MSTSSADLMARVAAALEHFDADASVAECHGTVAGWLCMVPALDRTRWLAHAAPGLDAADVLAGEAAATLDKLRQSTLDQLTGALMEFHPLLPVDAQPLDERVTALGEWCQGFLLGLSLGGLPAVAAMPGDSGEALNDLVQVSRAASYQLAGGEEDEAAYSELVEYVRAAVLLVHEEFRSVTDRAAEKPSVSPTSNDTPDSAAGKPVLH